MYLSKLKIKGYKTFNEEFEIKFNQKLTVLVGENCSGKTTVIDAIRLILNEDEYGRVGISKADFHRPFNKPSNDLGAKSFEVRSIFSSLSKKEQVAFLPWLDGSNNSTAYLNLKVENKENPRGKYNRIIWGGDSLSGIFEWELIDALACIYLPPLRDAEKKLQAYKGSRLSRLFRNEKPTGGKEHELEEKVRILNEELSKSQTITAANDQIKSYLKKSLGSFLSQDVLIQFSESSFDRIVEKLRLVFFPNITVGTNENQFREISENSLGYNNILYLATVLAELDRAKNSFLKILLIEEPEAHLHPQLQIRLMQYLASQANESNIQIIVTTHSAIVTSEAGIDSINIITQIEGSNPKATLIEDCKLDNHSKYFLERWLDINRSTLFFAKGLLFVEGLGEALIIKELSEKVIKDITKSAPNAPQTLEGYGVSIINLNGIYFKHFFQLFKGYKLLPKGTGKVDVDFIPIRCSGITDCDPDKSSIPTTGSSCLCKNPQYDLINELATNSTNCRLFSNLKTLEYDLGLEGNNLIVMIEIFNDWLDTKGDVKTKLGGWLKKDWRKEKEEDRAKASFELLNHIEKTKNKAKQKLGKGEFARLLGEKLNSNSKLDFEVPSYIKEAIRWTINK